DASDGSEILHNERCSLRVVAVHAESTDALRDRRELGSLRSKHPRACLDASGLVAQIGAAALTRICRAVWPVVAASRSWDEIHR
ncbi:hypothetical protein, partial [Streptomyces turgidiscabies]|uniref:hypothetical protein n=1 Tax=Streptomyces turgidiscabies TaxID=85558 RepID=UPI0038F7E03F